MEIRIFRTVLGRPWLQIIILQQKAWSFLSFNLVGEAFGSTEIGNKVNAVSPTKGVQIPATRRFNITNI